ncbi:hypothetical protein FH972_017207 [Carpinus fangiana]|uniref:NB-ARC domain-containing protein n=1 Tax=Carpinus fangiana TaxID=176857 RepID=A0A5N6RL78_9ROSI|nr:hypothetical protein FH972_017207 [Carpinus fangiana]
MSKQIYQAKERQIDMTDEIILISQLRKCLQQKGYVMVFDDVWKTEFWEIVKHALPCNDRGSRIIIITRSDLIGVSCKESLSDQVPKLQPLSEDKGLGIVLWKGISIQVSGVLSQRVGEAVNEHYAITCRGKSSWCWFINRAGKVEPVEDAWNFKYGSKKNGMDLCASLQNMVQLKGYDGEGLHFEEGGFQKLKRLTLKNLNRLKMVEIDRGSLPVLEQLQIGPCPQMKVPSGIQHLKSLKFLDFYEMQREFVLHLQPNRGKDYWKVNKVITICFSYKIKGEQYQIYKLGEYLWIAI